MGTLGAMLFLVLMIGLVFGTSVIGAVFSVVVMIFIFMVSVTVSVLVSPYFWGIILAILLVGQFIQ